MKKIACIILFTILTINAYGQRLKDLNSEMTRISTETALIIQSQVIDEYPLWSPNSDLIACNIQGEWYKFELTNINLADIQWHGQTIGMLTTQDAYSKLTDEELKAFEKVSKLNPREVTTKNGTKIELKLEEMTVSLIVTKKGEKANVLWTSGGGNCHSLVLSPDEKFVAYLCELTGLLIMKLQ